jgi:serine/threonine protein kinase
MCSTSKAYETFSFTESKTLEIVMELCTGRCWKGIHIVKGTMNSRFSVCCAGGDLHARMPYTEGSAAYVLKQILGAISFIHEREIIHRDIKL